MGQMKTIRKDDWTPTLLAAPDGRTCTPSSYREHRELIASGYRPTPAVEPQAAAEERPVDPAPSAATAAASVAAASANEAASSATAAESATAKTKTTRRAGGDQ